MSESRGLQFGPPAVEGRPRLLFSFSGGRTSAVMTKRGMDETADRYEIVTAFANTGEEDERTLEFVHQCDEHFGFNTVWLEAVVNPGGTTHKVVTYETASRNGEPFEAVIQKYGIPNSSWPHCTRELKLSPLRSYLRSIGWTDYYTAIGIRPDESRRVRGDPKIVYPLIDWFWMDKQDVNDWWESQPFNLRLQEHEGNCKWCWKKSDPKLLRLAQERREIFDFPTRMEALYPRVGAEFAKDPEARDRVFFRGRRSASIMLATADIVGSVPDQPSDPDADGGCSESCELLETTP